MQVDGISPFEMEPLSLIPTNDLRHPWPPCEEICRASMMANFNTHEPPRSRRSTCMNIDARVERLERSLRRYQFGFLCVLCASIAACGVAMSGKPAEELSVRKLTIVDTKGNPRCVLFSESTDDGASGVRPLDANGTMRIFIGTYANGDSLVQHFDTNAGRRIQAGTFPNGHARLTQFDRRGQTRIAQETLPSGQSSGQH